MNGLRLLVLAILALAVLDVASAQTRRVYPWCTQDNTLFGTMDCSYANKNQCMQSAWGNGQSCVQNPEYWWKIWYPNGKGKPRRQ